jgi:hypothetical protein
VIQHFLSEITLLARDMLGISTAEFLSDHLQGYFKGHSEVSACKIYRAWGSQVYC